MRLRSFFDEVITGFRIAPGGAQEYFGVKADLATYGKVVGGGMPIGVLAGKAKYMDALDGGFWRFGDDSSPPEGVTFFAGTFHRHPLAMAAANAVMKFLQEAGPTLQQETNDRTARFVKTMNDHFETIRVPMRLQGFSAIFYYDFHPNLTYAGLLFYFLRDRGVHIWEGRVGCLSIAHTDQDIDFLLNAFKESVAEMQKGGLLPGPDDAGLAIGAAQASEETRAPQLVTADMTARESTPFPLTEGQMEMWAAAQMAPDAAGPHHASNVVRIEGDLDVEALSRAISEGVNRHEALCATFNPDGTEIVVAPSVKVEVPFHDLSGEAVAEQDERVRRVLDLEGQRILDLVEGPLFSFQLIKVSAREHLLVFTVQMIVCDGWSYTLVLEDIGAIYSSMVEGSQPVLGPITPMREYLRWQRQQRDTAESAACEAFWLERFKTAPPPLDLPGFQVRPAERSSEGSRHSLRFPPELYETVKRAAKELRSTPFTVLLAAYEAWLYRLSDEGDLVIGVPFSGQSGAGLDHLVGQCVHMLPLRVKLEAEGDFASLVGSTQEELLDVQEHWNYSFSRLAQRLELPSDPSRIPLVSVMFNLDLPFSKVRFAGCTHRVTASPRYYFQYDLGFNLVDEGETLLVECDYNPKLFEADTIQQWVSHYQTLLEAAVANPSQTLGHLPLLNDAELRKRTVEWNDTSREYSSGATIHGLVAAQAARSPDAVAIECAAEKLTYAELERRANQLANLLHAEGVGSESLVRVCVSRSPAMVVALLGVLKAGAAYVPLDPDHPGDRIAYMLEDASADTILTEGILLPDLPATKARIICLDEDGDQLARQSAELGPTGSDPADLAYLMYTSGSTGGPKGVEITHGAVVNFLESMRREPGIRPDDVVLAATTLSFDISVLEIFLPLIVGARAFIIGRDVLVDPDQLGRVIIHHGVTVMQATPTTWRMLLAAGWRGARRLKVLCGGEALLPDLAERLLGCCGEL